MESSLFDWMTWRSGNISDIVRGPTREEILLDNVTEIIRYAIGWCPAEMIPCRPKTNYIAVMFYKDDVLFWTHLTKQEFIKIFVNI
jgi:hypothetical protein